MENNRFYVTTAIDYVNASPHIGHAYQKIVADVLARWNTILGREVLFVTGTDEHGKKIARSAKGAGKNPKEFVDEISKKFIEAWNLLNIKFDRFIRTTDEDHKEIVNNIIEKISKTGDIYKGEYHGLYCVNCEAYYTEKDLINGECPHHPGKKIEELKEETYFFKLSKYQDFLLKLYEEHPEFVLPEERRHEVINRVKEGLKDLSMSRTSIDWGLPFPLDKEHVIYVWFEALINYYTATQSQNRDKFWPADLHLLGKDNIWFHCVIWPAILKSADIPLPKTVFNHGFLTFNGQKISKSLGNSISIKTLTEKYPSDSIRYFSCRQFPFAEGNDGDFSEFQLIERHNNELANKFGNLVSRVTALSEKYGIEKTENKLLEKLKLNDIKNLFENYELDKALNLIFEFIDECNEFIQKEKIWETKNKEQLYQLIDSIKAISILLWPFIPETSEKVSKHLNFKLNFDNINNLIEIQKIKKAPILFKKIELKNDLIEGVKNMSEVKFDEWAKLDLRVGLIEKVDEVEGADKLIKLEVNLGEEIGKRIIVAGIKGHYKNEELLNQKFIFLANLEKKKLKGIESQGMVLAACTADHETISLIKPVKDIELGSKVS